MTLMAAAGVAALAAVAIMLSLLPGNTSGASPAAARLLAKIASTAARRPRPPGARQPFWYIKSWVSYLVLRRWVRRRLRPGEAARREIWQSVSNQCVTGLLREYGQNTPLTFSTNYLHCPYQGGVHDPTYRFLQSLPTDPHALLNLIEREMQGQQRDPEEAFTTIGDLLGEAIAPPRVSAALYWAAALIPGVTVVRGRHGRDGPPRHRGGHDLPERAHGVVFQQADPPVPWRT